MHLIPTTTILIPNTRQRREHDARLQLELQESIEKLGLMHPVVVSGARLIAGERRMRAIQDIQALGGTFRCGNQLIPPGMCPVNDLGELDPLARLEAELDENLRRKNLTWQEEVAAIAKLNELRKALNPAHSIIALTKEVTGNTLDASVDKMQYAVILARNLNNPEVARASTAQEAYKVIRRNDEAQLNRALGVEVGKTFSARDHTLILGDCLHHMPLLSPASFDVILTDPPYGIDAQDFGDAAGKLVGIDHKYDDSREGFEKLLTRAASEMSRVAKPEAHLYLCCDIDAFHWLKALFTEIGEWHVFRTPIINHKRNSGRVPLPEHGPRRCHEYILYAYRGNKRTTAIYPDVIDTEGDENRGYGAQKPVELFVNLLRRSCRPGDRVCDPFAGTGTIFPAAHRLQVRATGIELDPLGYGIGVKRLGELK